MDKWYVAKTKPGKERLVNFFLSERMGVEVFLPLIHHPVDKKSGLELLFPTYIFCFTDPELPDWPAVRYAPGVSYFLCTGNELTPVPDTVMAHLRERVSRWNDGAYSPCFTSGQRLVITSGPFSGLDAIFEKYVPSRKRCQVLLEIMGSLAKVEVPVDALGAKSPYRELALST